MELQIVNKDTGRVRANWLLGKNEEIKLVYTEGELPIVDNKNTHRLLYSYLDNGKTIDAGTSFSIEKVWHNCVQTTIGLISIDAWPLCVEEIKIKTKV